MWAAFGTLQTSLALPSLAPYSQTKKRNNIHKVKCRNYWYFSIRTTCTVLITLLYSFEETFVFLIQYFPNTIFASTLSNYQVTF